MSPALAQMMSLYAMRGTVTSSMLVAISSDPGLVRAAVSLLAAGMIGVQLLNHDGCRSPQVQSLMAAQGADGA